MLIKIDLLLLIWSGLMIVSTKAVFENFEEFKKLHAAFGNLTKEKIINEGNLIPNTWRRR